MYRRSTVLIPNRLEGERCTLCTIAVYSSSVHSTVCGRKNITRGAGRGGGGGEGEGEPGGGGDS